MRIDDHKPDCVIWESEVDFLECNCKINYQGKRLVSDWVEQLRQGLDFGFSTEEIAEDIGIKYESMREQLRRHGDREGYEELRNRLKALRNDEYERNRAAEENWERNRCAHGVWTSDGECNHGKLGRRAKVAA